MVGGCNSSERKKKKKEQGSARQPLRCARSRARRRQRLYLSLSITRANIRASARRITAAGRGKPPPATRTLPPACNNLNPGALLPRMAAKSMPAFHLLPTSAGRGNQAGG